MAHSKELFSELTKACQRETVRSDDEVIERGATTWFCGVPAPAEAGTVALSMGDAQIIIREKDVRWVAKDGDDFKVEVSSDANILLRIEKAVRAGGEPKCTCSTQADGGAVVFDVPADGGKAPPLKPDHLWIPVGSTGVRISIATDFDG